MRNKNRLSQVLSIILILVMAIPGTIHAAPAKAEENVSVERLAGKGRMETAVEVSQMSYEEGAEAVVLSGYHGEVDALTGTLLANAKKAPVLLTEQKGLSKVTKNEIVRLNAKKVYILGGDQVVSKQVVSDLEELDGVKVERVSGHDRYETAHKVATEVSDKTSHVFLALGADEFLSDALSVGPVSAMKDMPVLLTAKNYIPEATKDAMKTLGVSDVTIIGGDEAISEDLKKELEEDYIVDRVSGRTREQTATAIANRYFESSHQAIIANDGRVSYADALVSGYLGALQKAPILLTQNNVLPKATEDYLTVNTDQAFILGGDLVVSEDILKEIQEVVEISTKPEIPEEPEEETPEKPTPPSKPEKPADKLEEQKEEAKKELRNYKDATEYTENAESLAQAITAGETAIDEATTADGIDEALESAKSKLNAIKTDEEMQHNQSVKNTLDTNLNYIYEAVKNPTLGTGSGEWSILALARGGYDVPEEYYDLYYENVAKKVNELMAQNDNKLDKRKGTEHSRLMLGLSAVGRDVTDVGGYNIKEALGDFDYMVWQGINGPIFSLIALDSYGYDVPVIEGVKNQSTREKYVEDVLKKAIKSDSGEVIGWALFGNDPDADITGMAIQALTPYYDQTDVKKSVDGAINWLSTAQNEAGGYSSWGTENSESAAQVIVALTGLGIDPHTDARFVKNGTSLIDNLLTYAVEDGGFAHIKPAKRADGMATDQGTYALVAYDRFVKGQNRLYDMSDVVIKEKSLGDLKVDMKLALRNYKDATKYTENAEALAQAIEAGETAIDGATTADGIDEALESAKSELNAIKTDEELLADKLEEQKEEAKKELRNYKDATEYTENAEALAQAIEAGEVSIEEAQQRVQLHKH